MPFLGGQELLVIFLIIVLLFGASKLPELARSMGKAKKEFKKGMEDEDEDGAADKMRDETKKMKMMDGDEKEKEKAMKMMTGGDEKGKDEEKVVGGVSLDADDGK